MAWNFNNKISQSTDFDSDDNYEINPTVYINLVIRGIIDAPIKALENGKPFDEGLYSYTLGVETLELICRANKWVGGENDDYEKILREKISLIKTELDNEKVMSRKDAKISKIKFELLLTRILDTRMKESNLKV